MLHLYFMRHGEAEGSHPDGDGGRRLTKKGEAEIRAIGKAARRLGLQWDAVFASPLERARRTAELLIHEVKSAPAVRILPALAEGGRAADFLRELSEVSRGKHVLFVGHQPMIGDWVLELSGTRLGIEKGSMTYLELEGLPSHGKGRLRWYRRPVDFLDE